MNVGIQQQQQQQLPAEVAVLEGTMPISMEQLRAAFENGSPKVVYDNLQPFLSVESRSNGDAQAIGEISASVSKLLYPWFQNSLAMRLDEKRALYMLLRPDGLLIDTLLQYHILRCQQRAPPAYTQSLQTQTLPVEFHGSKSASLPAEFARRLAPGSGADKDTSVGVDALEYFVYHFCRAVVPPRENTTDMISSTGRGGQTNQANVPGSVVSDLLHEYIHFFLPACVPDKQLNSQGEIVSDRNPIKQIRSRLHDMSPRKTYTGPQDIPLDTRKPGNTDVDLLDACEYSHALGLATYFASCATLLWLPVISKDLWASISAATKKEPSKFASESSFAHEWVWIPSFSHLAALELFCSVVKYLAKGERQMERYHLTGMIPEVSPVAGFQGAGHRIPTSSAGAQYVEAFGKRISMSSTIRDTLRLSCLSTPIADTLGLVLASCRRAGLTDTDIWVPFLSATAGIWIRYIMPWRGSQSASTASSPSELSPVWQARIPLMAKNLVPALYGQTFALFLQCLTARNIDILTQTTLRPEWRHGSDVRSQIGEVVESVFGDRHAVDALKVIEHVVTAFTGNELLAIMAAMERSQNNAYPRLRNSQLALDSSAAPRILDPTAVAVDSMLMNTPTKPNAKLQELQQSSQSAEDSVFESLIADAQKHLSPYTQEVIALSTGSQVLDSVMKSALGRPPVCIVFNRLEGAPNPPLLQSSVRSLHSAELLAERKLRLIASEQTGVKEAKTAVDKLTLVLSEISNIFFGQSSSWSSGMGSQSMSTSGANGATRDRAKTLQKAQSRINALYEKIAAVFNVPRKTIDDIKAAQDDSMLTPDVSGVGNGGSSNGFGKRLAARGNPSEWSGGSVDAPDMEHGSLTPRGRWELKTGRKKFTAQSLLASPRSVSSPSPFASGSARCTDQTPAHPMSPPPKWGLHPRGQTASMESDSTAYDADVTLVPRGPRAVYQARSYEYQWILTQVLRFNPIANQWYQDVVNYLEQSAYPIPKCVREYELNFRWVAARQNLNCFGLLILLVLLCRLIIY
ncbi:hypothetical protein LPJ53_003916 [Coemansia erecta]|uniref:Uncharacterized protein n=1 Tax=Coemansia erecta TaxID=147472 RepID=A0A9W8CS85_9FUNG|nr:hypothetical protein LPJ53_003916 [Coemansia erecta]